MMLYLHFFSLIVQTKRKDFFVSKEPQRQAETSLLQVERRLRGWSRAYVADQIGCIELTVLRWESGKYRPGPYHRKKLCALFGKSEQELGLLPGDLLAQQQEAAHKRVDDPLIPLPEAIGLIGRDTLLESLKLRLCQETSVTVLGGIPGVGKTALAVALAHDSALREYFRDGILWAALGPTPNIPGLLFRWGALLGISQTEMAGLHGDEAWARAIRTAIGKRTMLLVIDDVWELEVALLFQVGGPHCSHLVTTRFRDIAAHIAVGETTTLQELSATESMTLLQFLASGVVEYEEEKAQRMVQAVGGLPLALRLLGNYLRKQAHSGQRRRITAALTRLEKAEERLQISEPYGPVQTHPSLPGDRRLSLRSVIAVTDQTLPEEARAALYALAVFPPKPNSFSEDAALAVAACKEETLDVLIDAGLLESNGDRYTLHQTIADYGLVLLQQDDTASLRLITYVMTFLETHKRDYELLEVESSIILATLEMASSQRKLPALVRLVTTYAPFLLLRGFYTLAEQHIQRAHQAAMTLNDTAGLIRTFHYLGEVAQKQGRFPEAIIFLQESLVRARQARDHEHICAVLTDLGWVTWKQGKFKDAKTSLQEGLVLARQMGDHERIAHLLKVLGAVVAEEGHLALSETYLQEGLGFARQIGDRELLCVYLINLGATLEDMGETGPRAKAYLEEGLVLARQIGHREWTSILLINLAYIAGLEGNLSLAEAYLQESLKLSRQIGHREWMSLALINLGELALDQGDEEQAEAYLQEGLALARQVGRPFLIAEGLYDLAMVSLRHSQLEKASMLLQEMFSVIPEGAKDLAALAHYGSAHVAAADGKREEAYQLGMNSLKGFTALGDRRAEEVQSWLDTLSQK
jgi:tetratricopeptide (TPR) repeat protein/transcriptional regulator with XRE-family HTH domain